MDIFLFQFIYRLNFSILTHIKDRLKGDIINLKKLKTIRNQIKKLQNKKVQTFIRITPISRPQNIKFSYSPLFKLFQIKFNQNQFQFLIEHQVIDLKQNLLALKNFNKHIVIMALGVTGAGKSHTLYEGQDSICNFLVEKDKNSHLQLKATVHSYQPDKIFQPRSQSESIQSPNQFQTMIRKLKPLKNQNNLNDKSYKQALVLQFAAKQENITVIDLPGLQPNSKLAASIRQVVHLAFKFLQFKSQDAFNAQQAGKHCNKYSIVHHMIEQLAKCQKVYLLGHLRIQQCLFSEQKSILSKMTNILLNYS